MVVLCQEERRNTLLRTIAAQVPLNKGFVGISKFKERIFAMKNKRRIIGLLVGTLALGISTGAWTKAHAEEQAAPSDDSSSPALSQAETDAINKAVADKMASSQSGVKVDIHGFAELDLIGDDTESFKETIGNAAVSKPGTTAGGNGQMLASPRNSRISFLAQVPEVNGWKSKGYLELDFLGYDPAPNYQGASTTLVSAPTESAFYTQPGIRIRHAYVEVQKDGWDILAGQFWTLFGWQADYLLSTMTPGASVMGELFQRTPQVRVSKTFGDDTKVQVSIAADRPEESASEAPNFDGGLRFSLGGGPKARFASPVGPVNAVPFSIGLSGTLRNYAYGTAGTNVDLDKTAQGEAVAVDLQLPVVPTNAEGDSPSLVLTGEWTGGKGDADQLFLWTGGLAPLSTASNGINLDAGVGGFQNGNFVLVDMQSWDGQLQFQFPKAWATFVTAGYGENFSDNVGNLGGTYNDGSVIFANLLHDFSAQVRAGVEYDRFETHYLAGVGSNALDHRIMVSSWYRF